MQLAKVLAGRCRIRRTVARALSFVESCRALERSSARRDKSFTHSRRYELGRLAPTRQVRLSAVVRADFSSRRLDPGYKACCRWIRMRFNPNPARRVVMIAPKKLLVCSVLAILPACKESGAPAPSTTTASPAPSAVTATAPATETAKPPAATAAGAAAPGAAPPASAAAAPAAEAAVAAPTVAVADPTSPVIEAGCSYDARQLEGKDGTAYRVSCPASCDNGSVYGTGVYTADTSICRAGIHAGAIPAEGGTLTLVLQPGRPAYRGSEQNGIESRDYGKYSRSFAIVTAGRAPAGSVTAASAAAGAEVAAGSQLIEAGCSFDARQLTSKDGALFRVACPAGCEAGTIYGTGVYTADSSICRAGVHSGVIPESGGVVTITLEPGRPAYRGSDQNGIKSRDYGKYSSSFAVVTKGGAPAGSAGAVAPAPAAPTTAQAAGTAGVIEAGCSYDARQLDGSDGTTFRIACPAGCEIPSTAYGTGVYTADSPICKSAIHAGAIPASGGVATIKLEAGRPAYRGSEQNGIKSRDYGKYSRSYAVVTEK